MTKEELISNLIQVAHEEVSKHNCYFSDEADAQLKELVTAGVDRMSLQDRYNNERIATAQNNMRYLCIKVCEETKKENHLIVENRTFSSTRWSICPLWPFC